MTQGLSTTRGQAPSVLQKTTIPPPLLPLSRRLLPWLLFGLMLLWGWRLDNPFTFLPAYGDNLEAVWTIDWWYQSLVEDGRSPEFTSAVFHPEGWQSSSQSYAPILLLFTLPFTFIGGAAFSYNATILILLAISLAGVFRLARSLGSTLWLASLAAILSTFWGFAWLRIGGHWQILWGYAFLPWIAWSLERSIRRRRREWIWLFVTAVLWALAIGGSLYFIFLGGLLVVGWNVGQLLGQRVGVRRMMVRVTSTVLVMVVLSMPVLTWFWCGIKEAQSLLPDIFFLNKFGASLNSLPIPFLGHPWFGSLSKRIYSGPADESGVANLGTLAFLAVCITLVFLWRNTRYRSLVILLFIGLVFALGPTLKWNGQSIVLPVLEPVNTLIWRAGNFLKPAVFPTAHPPEEFAHAIPLPGMIMAVLLPFWEGARVSSRYILLATASFFPLAVIGVQYLRARWVWLIIGASLIVEILPPPVHGVPYPPVSHPAFSWLSEQSLGGFGVIDLHAQDEERLALPISGETVYATILHGQSTAAGVGSIFPEHAFFLREWFFTNIHPFNQQDLATLLRGFKIRYVLLHMTSEIEWRMLDDLPGNKELGLVECFPSSENPSPWSEQICVIEVRPEMPGFSSMHFDSGWSEAEPWGIWAEGAESRVQWIATRRGQYTLAVDAFPHCVEGEIQAVAIIAGDEQIAAHSWQGCNSWQEIITIPDDAIDVGWNELLFVYDYAARPVDVTGGQNPDSRPLSVGFTRLEVIP